MDLFGLEDKPNEPAGLHFKENPRNPCFLRSLRRLIETDSCWSVGCSECPFMAVYYAQTTEDCVRECYASRSSHREAARAFMAIHGIKE